MIQKYAIMALVAIAIAISGFFYGKHVESAERDALILKEVKIEIAKANEIATKDFAETLKAEQEKATRRLEEEKRNVKIVKQIQTNTIYSNVDCNLPDDGMRLWNDEARGKEIPTTERDGSLPERATPTE